MIIKDILLLLSLPIAIGIGLSFLITLIIRYFKRSSGPWFIQLLIFPTFFWIILMIMNVKIKTFSNLTVEPALIGCISGALSYFWHSQPLRAQKNQRRFKLQLISTSLIATVLLFIIFPALPE